MRKPSEYIAAALRRIQSGPLADSAMVLECDCVSATVTRVGSPTSDATEMVADDPSESVRVMCAESDIPNIRKGDVATLDGSIRFITSVRNDSTNTIKHIGMSDALMSHEASVSGKRETKTGARNIRITVTCAVVTSGFADPVTEYDTATGVKRKRIVVAKKGDGAWTDTTAPRPGDVFRFDGGERYAVVTVEESRSSYYYLEVRKC